MRRKSKANPLRVIVQDSVLPYPDRARDRAKYFFWRMVFTHIHCDLRDGLLKAKVIKHNGRQDYLIGTVDLNRLGELLKHLRQQGFGGHNIAWEDDEELIGMRRLENFDFQYHIRIFKDGEIRGHYEYTPESHCIRHMKKKGQQERREEFQRMLGGLVSYV